MVFDDYSISRNGICHLAMGYHEIFGFRVVKNKFDEDNPDETKSKKIIVELQNEIVFLPQYFLQHFNKQDIEALDFCGAENMYLFVLWWATQRKKIVDHQGCVSRRK